MKGLLLSPCMDVDLGLDMGKKEWGVSGPMTTPKIILIITVSLGSCAVRDVGNFCYMSFILPCWLCFLCPGMLLLGSVLCSLGEESGV